jgi:hypothetical protein
MRVFVSEILFSYHYQLTVYHIHYTQLIDFVATVPNLKIITPKG